MAGRRTEKCVYADGALAGLTRRLFKKYTFMLGTHCASPLSTGPQPPVRPCEGCAHAARCHTLQGNPGGVIMLVSPSIKCKRTPRLGRTRGVVCGARPGQGDIVVAGARAKQELRHVRTLADAVNGGRGWKGGGAVHRLPVARPVPRLLRVSLHKPTGGRADACVRLMQGAPHAKKHGHGRSTSAVCNARWAYL